MVDTDMLVIKAMHKKTECEGRWAKANCSCKWKNYDG